MKLLNKQTNLKEKEKNLYRNESKFTKTFVLKNKSAFLSSDAKGVMGTKKEGDGNYDLNYQQSSFSSFNLNLNNLYGVEIMNKHVKNNKELTSLLKISNSKVKIECMTVENFNSKKPLDSINKKIKTGAECKIVNKLNKINFYTSVKDSKINLTNEKSNVRKDNLLSKSSSKLTNNKKISLMLLSKVELSLMKNKQRTGNNCKYNQFNLSEYKSNVEEINIRVSTEKNNKCQLGKWKNTFRPVTANQINAKYYSTYDTYNTFNTVNSSITSTPMHINCSLLCCNNIPQYTEKIILKTENKKNLCMSAIFEKQRKLSHKVLNLPLFCNGNLY